MKEVAPPRERSAAVSRVAADRLLERVGFAASDTGPYVSALREQMRSKVRDGLSGFGVSWSSEAPVEDRARALLAVDWAISRGHTARVECLDGLRTREWNLETGRSRTTIRWKRIPAWLRDQWRRAVCDWRKWRDRKLPNPYGIVDAARTEQVSPPIREDKPHG